ncbi:MULTISPECIES: SAM-dependent methyltransferase [Legionella]|uniref:SAM-dependent methyltransferase n=1 Tax=Legionella resiliens TaxID=2905958 RepID=A0ABS8X6P2_9GAMM|nr:MULTISPECIES: SAM-dependent methyltransferase [unclassified Legionella]MCE0723743.1 SAM-dependent methyltransferase [Legionella sp. 9fVS26]MCE3532895.1 SAM-dependent methyltransferase [Legionella sp. 8cVS16]QLZ69083.1 SAM-dependent methyltransferase [Legionella sp. PC1000]
MEKKIAAVYVSKPEFLSLLSEELDDVLYKTEDLIFSSHKRLDVCFAQDIWLEPQKVSFQSISEAVRILRQAGKFWYLHPISHIRRSRLIEEQLRKLPPLERHFPFESEIPSIGAFALLDNNTLIYSVKRQKKWPQGKCYFIEDKINPPNRAYLKLWEALTLLGKYPKPGDEALDLGASPGGWTYVMHSLGASVTAVDKALLDPKIAQLPRVTSLQQSAFALEPAQLEQNYDWVLSDVACYPDRAYALIMKWIESGKAKQMIFTIKLQGKIELSTLKQFQKIPNSFLTNMFYNKHEATFVYPFVQAHEESHVVIK